MNRVFKNRCLCFGCCICCRRIFPFLHGLFY
uniref:Uncharacterized protein n=1 Tax=Arundo donax TaxID=35708 RepID=A0A0A9GH73_ARUDO